MRGCSVILYKKPLQAQSQQFAAKSNLQRQAAQFAKGRQHYQPRDGLSTVDITPTILQRVYMCTACFGGTSWRK